MRRTVLSATLAGLLLFTAACGDDEESSGSNDTEQEDSTSNDDGKSDDESAGDVDTDISVGNIPGLSEDCESLYGAWLSIFAGIGVPGAQIPDAESTIDALQEALPDDLDDDAAVFGAAISQYFAVLAEHVDDANAYADPEVLAALEGIGAEQVGEAQENINDYFEETCPVGG